ncbi:CHAT domain-containing protein, partial [Actinomadura sp. K4S16]|uniref:CHAT domain-containing protein n=1 Tax=Actinomadura sp. K4S16 TaxID=1316147 RepID=UPI0011EFD10C
MSDRVRVFISYAHDSDEHQESVREFWTLLRAQGIDARLDLPAAEERQDWPTWMRTEVQAADFVMVIASPEYRRAADDDAPPDERRGVRWEKRHLIKLLYRDYPTYVKRILPVVLPGRSKEEIPDFLDAETSSSFEVSEFTAAGVERLVRLLTGQPYETAPPLGSVPTLPPRSQPPSSVTGPARVGAGLVHQVLVRVGVESGRVRSETQVAGGVLGVREGALPLGLGGVWRALGGPAAMAERRLAEAGEALAGVLWSEETAAHLERLVMSSPLGSAVDVVFELDRSVADLPVELVRLAGAPLVTMSAVRVRRRVPGAGGAVVGPLPGPLKILVAVSAPDEGSTRSAPLDVEAEMQAVLDAVADAHEQHGAQVRVLEVASSQQIATALQKDQYHVLHLSAHGSPTMVELCDEDGRPEQVDAAGTVEVLRAGENPLPLVVISACAAAAATGDGGPGLAELLVERGADRVLAMQASVTDSYATSLAARFYSALAGDPSVTPAQALGRARAAVEAARQRIDLASRPLPEYGTAVLLSAGDDLPLRLAGGAAQPLSQPTRPPAGSSVAELPLGALVGRRPQLRTTMTVLRGGPRAREYGAVAGVVLTGVGGIGKTALAGRAKTRLGDEGWLTAVHTGVWNPSELINTVAQAMRGETGFEQAVQVLTDPGVEDTGKVAIIGQVLRQVPLLVVFDDFEQNLTDDGTAFTDPGFADIFTAMCEQAQRGKILVTCRYPLPDMSLLHQVALPPLSTAELRRMLLRMPKLATLPPEDRRVLVGAIGGHPRLIEFVNALLSHGRGNLFDVTRKLRDLATSQGIVLTGTRPLAQAVDEAMLLGTRDILLGHLLTLLTEEQIEVLLQAAVSTAPMSPLDLTRALHDAPTLDRQRRVTIAIHRLTDLTLLSPAPDSEIVMHPWIAAAANLHQVDQSDQSDQRHRRALAMRNARFQDGRGSYEDLLDIARHHAALREYDDLAGYAYQAAVAIAAQLGELSVTAFLGEIIPLTPHDHRSRLRLLDREATALIRTGNLQTAATRVHAAL